MTIFTTPQGIGPLPTLHVKAYSDEGRHDRRLMRAAKPAGVPMPMRKEFKVGDHVEWNSEAGRVRGTIVKKITRAIQFKGYTVRASVDEPQYKIQSDKTDHVAMHKGSALKKLPRRKRSSP